MKDKFLRLAEIVIDKLEGGYFHPDMLTDGRLPNTDRLKRIYGISGETMMGIDRKNGGSLNTTPAGKKFWALIDSSNKQKWKWNYKGGSLEPQLRRLAAEILYPHFLKLHNMFLSAKAQKVIARDERLFLHFVYATWNGAGRFREFANKFNSAVQHTTNKDRLVQIAMQHRLDRNNSLYAMGVKKMQQIFSEMKNNKGVFVIMATFGFIGIGAGIAIKKLNND